MALRGAGVQKRWQRRVGCRRPQQTVLPLAFRASPHQTAPHGPSSRRVEFFEARKGSGGILDGLGGSTWADDAGSLPHSNNVLGLLTTGHQRLSPQRRSGHAQRASEVE